MSRDDCDACDEEFAKLHGQIATLKTALISDRSKLLFLFKDRIFGMPEIIIGSDRFKENAINKLAQEYPEIFVEEK
jgi:hypothetical protein